MNKYAKISLYLGFFSAKNRISKSPAMQIERESSRLRFGANCLRRSHEIV
jgi:hypothetical protein